MKTDVKIAVQIVRLIVVDRKLYFLSVYFVSTTFDTVCNRTYRSPEKAAVLSIFPQFIIAQHDIFCLALLIRHIQILKDRAEGDHLRTHPVLVGDRIAIHCLAVFGLTEKSFRYRHSFLPSKYTVTS